jgi:hypothetical protein
VPLPPAATRPAVRRSARHGSTLVWLTLSVAATAVVAGCDAPPQPLPTAPPRSSVSPSASASAYPTVAPTRPSTTLPPYTPPIAVPPALPVTTPPARPAAKCRTGPSAAQVLAAVRDKPGVPAGQPLRVSGGPYCAGGWQFAEVRLVNNAESEPLLVVTRGRPTALTLVEAGADVCSERVQAEAPAGIQARACGP